MNLPPYSIFPELRHSELLLREVKSKDIPSLLEILTYDGKKPETLEEGIAMTNRIHQNYLDGDTVNWVIEYLPTKELIGFVGYYRGFENGTGELGFILKSSFRGKGLMSPALLLAVEFGLNSMKLSRVIAITGKENSKAIALLERTGFVFMKELSEKQLEFRFNP
ncbi:MAG: GCN5-related N-acetyltransferase [Fluviicola sp.]|jgi:ribosomal-protein-alanine N-acetyltransferase|uniref:GNAT family N-acetyltransferase n=1 Tax=Fluviicola sp. TaxID=1917219 RepID=UPI002637A53C|nr:GNAT family N-acetyltransferase [Fluviicola sp.]MDF3026289.1 GCN5-related N-acetyltransferase [Fluviicola sp.]